MSKTRKNETSLFGEKKIIISKIIALKHLNFNFLINKVF